MSASDCAAGGLSHPFYRCCRQLLVVDLIALVRTVLSASLYNSGVVSAPSHTLSSLSVQGLGRLTARTVVRILSSQQRSEHRQDPHEAGVVLTPKAPEGAIGAGVTSVSGGWREGFQVSIVREVSPAPDRLSVISTSIMCHHSPHSLRPFLYSCYSCYIYRQRVCYYWHISGASLQLFFGTPATCVSCALALASHLLLLLLLL